MKKISLALVMAAALFSCKKENSNKSTVPVPIPGKWHLQADTLTIFQNDIETAPLINGATTIGFNDVEFYSNGQFAVADGRTYLGYPMWEQNGTNLNLTYPSAVSQGPLILAKVETGTILLHTASRIVVRFESFSTTAPKNGYVTTRDYVKVK